MHYILPDEAYDELEKYAKSNGNILCLMELRIQLLENYSELFNKDSLDWYKENFNQLEKEFNWFYSLTLVNGSEQLSIFNKNTLPIKYSQYKGEAYQLVFPKRHDIKKELENYDFKDADDLYEKNKTNIHRSWYEEKKVKHIQRYFQDEFVKKSVIDNAPDLEQAEAIGALGEKVLVSARAGAGKTQTIAGKVALLVNKYDINPNEILVLCFNRSAAEEMKKRIEKYVKGFENAKTFHSFAYSIVSPKKNDILFDKDGEFSEKKFSSFVRELIEIELQTSSFKSKIYDFFRDDYEKLDKNLSEQRHFKNKEDRYLYLRNETESTLSGGFVKSRGEKWIADFLFEHNIEFYYEQQFSLIGENKSYHPDFTLRVEGEKYVLEHWGIDEYDSKKEVPEFWTKTWEEYKKEMNDKREYFSKNDKYKDKFIQTSIRDIEYPLSENSRLKFEETLKIRLEKKGIVCKKLEKHKLIERVWEKQLFNRFNTLMVQFIGWMQKLEWIKEDIQNELKEGNWSKKQKVFCELGLLIYEKYQHELKGKMDFNILMSQVIKKMKSDKSNANISHIKYILIDEFQDFSQLFQNLIDAIKEINPKVNLFCVGDDWQLINGFSGSDEKFFKEFGKNANNKKITTCYRSELQIIENGNRFTTTYPYTFEGEKSKSFKEGKGCIEIISIDDEVYIKHDSTNITIDNEFKKYFRKKKNNSDEKFLPTGDYLKARYLKKCFQIIKENPNKSFLFLSRNNKLEGIALSDFFTKESSFLKKLLKEQQVNTPKIIKAMTMHKSKGLEADIVILLDITEKTIPSIHPSNELFEIFGRTPKKILDEEKRLFYVALTRAKEKLFILTEKGRESEFLSAI